MIGHSSTFLNQPAWDPLNVTFAYDSVFYTNVSTVGVEGTFAEASGCTIGNVSTANLFTVTFQHCSQPFLSGDTLTATISLFVTTSNAPDEVSNI